jgi:hypothetical protein
MRWIGTIALLALAAAAPVHGQVLWLGAADGTSWEYQAQTAPGQDFSHNNQQAASVFVAFPIESDTLIRLGAANVPHNVLIDGHAWGGHLRAYTIGADYLIRSVYGQSVLSAGLGSYGQELQARNPPPGFNDTKVGWYLGVGEWFNVLPRMRVTAEIKAHRTHHQGTTTVFVASAGLAVWF